MKISGIVCEFNPFHNGHRYHIEQTRKNGASHIIAVMSGNFVQRGDTAVLDKFTRAKLAVKSGADLVIELPVQYCLSPAELFARGAVYLLHSLGVADELSFGSECGDIEKLVFTADKLESLADSAEIRSLTENGYTYPKAVSAVLSDKYPNAAEIVSQPNNVLAVEYIKALKYFSSEIKPFTVKRTGTAHDSNETAEGFASASYIRQHITSARGLVPDIWADALDSDVALFKRLERVILYRLRTASLEEIARTNDSVSGLAERIYAARSTSSINELLEAVKTKRYTMARIRRIILSLLIGIAAEDMSSLPPYGRILALNERGREILAAAKGKSKIPFDTSLARLSRLNGTARRFAELEAQASDIYGLAKAKIDHAQQDYRAKVKIDLE